MGHSTKQTWGYFFAFFHPYSVPTNHPRNRATITSMLKLSDLVIVGSARRDIGMGLVIESDADDLFNIARERDTLIVDRGIGLDVTFDRDGEAGISCREYVLGSVRL